MDVVTKTLKTNPGAQYPGNLMIREWVDDTLGDGNYDVRGALNILEGMVLGTQGIVQQPTVYEMAAANGLCTEELHDFVLSLIIDGSTIAFIALQMRGDGVQDVDKQQMERRVKDNYRAFYEGCYFYEPTGVELTHEGVWGDWGDWEDCPNGGYVTSFKEKVEGHSSTSDDSGLNSVCLICSQGEEVCSSQGAWGDWGDESDECKEGFSGSNLKFEAERHGGVKDETAGNDLRLMCNGEEVYAGNGGNFGEWEPNNQNCPSGQVICGIKTRVEQPRGIWHDDSALNGVSLKCCKDKWVI